MAVGVVVAALPLLVDVFTWHRYRPGTSNWPVAPRPSHTSDGWVPACCPLTAKRRTVSPARLKMVICVPSGVTAVERKAVRDSAERANGREVYLVEEPVAAAIGIGIDISKPVGNMIVDIGGGTSEIQKGIIGDRILKLPKG